MERFDNEVQSSEVSSVQGAIEKRVAQERHEILQYSLRSFDLQEDTTEHVQSIQSSVRDLQLELERDKEAISEIDRRTTMVQGEIWRDCQRLIEIHPQVNHWHDKINSCIVALNTITTENRANKIREQKILALMEEERKLMAELEDRVLIVRPNSS